MRPGQFISSRRAMALAMVVAVFAAAAYRGGRVSAPAVDRFILSAAPAPAPSAAQPWSASQFISESADAFQVHASSLAELPDGRLMAAWYGGTREGARDVSVYLSRQSKDRPTAWERPWVAVTPEAVRIELGRPIRKLGNPLIWAGGRGRLHLLFVTVSFGGWACSSLNLKTSEDEGRTWSAARRLVLSPFFNISELVRNPPVPIAPAGWAIPIYHEMAGKYPELLELSEGPLPGEWRWAKRRIAGGRSWIQPAIAVTGPQTALAAFRSCGPDRRMAVAHTKDAGRTWSPPAPTGLPNPDAAVGMVSLAADKLLAAYNDSTGGREKLALALSRDQGATWRRVALVESEPGSEFSYPSLLAGREGKVHLSYTWKRARIKHFAFNLAWLAQQEQEQGDAHGGAP